MQVAVKRAAWVLAAAVCATPVFHACSRDRAPDGPGAKVPPDGPDADGSGSDSSPLDAATDPLKEVAIDAPLFPPAELPGHCPCLILPFRRLLK